MTIYYTSTTAPPSENQIETWEHLSQKKNWRIVKLPSGYFQTEFRDKYGVNVFQPMTRRTSIEAAEEAIDETIGHFKHKLSQHKIEVVKTFENE
jgi:hypothetical protein